MKFVKPSYEILHCPDGEEVLRLLELAARNCYKSEDKIDPGQSCDPCCSAGTVWDNTLRKDIVCPSCHGSGWAREPSSYKLVRKILRSGHHSVIEHASITVRFVVNRGVTHELVRHRIASYSQESTRYCNYNKGKFGSELTIVEPSHRLMPSPDLGDTAKEVAVQRRQLWEMCLAHVEETYNRLIELGEKPQEARDILPIGLKTEIVTTANLREWRHIFRLRALNERAHPADPRGDAAAPRRAEAARPGGLRRP
jgi:thymidylate synthase (FAD)